MKRSEKKLNDDGAVQLVRKEHPFSRFKSDFIQSPVALLGLVSCVLILLAAILGQPNAHGALAFFQKSIGTEIL